MPIMWSQCKRTSGYHCYLSFFKSNYLSVWLFFIKSGHILGLDSIRLSNAATFCNNYTKFYFEAKHLEKGLNNRGGGRGSTVGALYQKSALSGQYRMLP